MAFVPPKAPLQGITEFIQQLVSIPSVESKQAIATFVSEKPAALDSSHL